MNYYNRYDCGNEFTTVFHSPIPYTNSIDSILALNDSW